MIERQFITQKNKEFEIKKYIEKRLSGVGISLIRLKKIPLGEKIIIFTSKPSLIVGSKGANIRDLTKALKKDFGLENPQIEINEIKDIFLDPAIVADRIASSLERFGSARFKGIGHKMMENVIQSGGRGVEIIVSGKIPGARAKSWRFYQGYLKKCGDIAMNGVKKAKRTALLKSGIIGIKVSIMPPELELPDTVDIRTEKLVAEIPQLTETAEKKNVKKKSPAKKKPAKKKEETDKTDIPEKEKTEKVSVPEEKEKIEAKDENN